MSRLTLKKLNEKLGDVHSLVNTNKYLICEFENETARWKRGHRSYHTEVDKKIGFSFVIHVLTFMIAVAALISCTPANKALCQKDDGSLCHKRTAPDKEEVPTTVVSEPVSEYLPWMTIVDRDDSICDNLPNGAKRGDLGFEEKNKVPNTFNHWELSRGSNGTITHMRVGQSFSNSYLFSLEGKELNDWIDGKGKFEVREVDMDEYYVQGKAVEFGYHYYPATQFASIQILGKVSEGSSQFRVNFLTVLDDFTPITMCEYNGVYYLVLEENSIILIDKDNVRQQAVHTGQVWSN